MQKSFNQSVQFIKSFVRYAWFKSPTIFKASPIFGHTHPIIIKVTFLESQYRKGYAHFLSPPSKNY